MRRAGCLCALALLVCQSASLPLAAQADQGFDRIVDRLADDWMRFHSDAAAARRYFSGEEQDRVERQIEPVTAARRAARLQLIRRSLEDLGRVDRARLTASQVRSLDIITWDLTTQRDAEAYRDYYFPFAQNYGVDAALIGLLTINHTVRVARDAENYLARLGLVATRMDEAVAEARRLTAAKLLPPRFILQTTAAQMRGFLDLPPDRNPFVTAFSDKLAVVDGLPEAERRRLRDEAERVTRTEIYPAWRRALVLVEGQVAAATDAAGLWRFPQGAAAYQQALRTFTTTAMTPDQIHDLGLRMVNEIEGRMNVVLSQLGYVEGPVRDRMTRLMDEQEQIPDTPEGRATYQAFVTEIIRDAERRAASLFDRSPRMPVVARPYPDFMGGRAASYSIGTTDGARPGTFQYPVAGVALSRFGLRSLAYHEAVPGHHFQSALQAEDPALPKFLQNRVFGNNSAIGEGWALYAERLAAESGWYADDPIGLLGQLQAALFRARRLVVDTGLHAKRWTRRQAVDYIGPQRGGVATESEIDRYVSQPGQATSYMVGELKIVELRERARMVLGDRFSLGEFHNRVLAAGRVPLDILEQDVERWIAEKRR